ncbi:hypothetical protein TNCV_1611111 [Trichonephila clavipes]|nr:hypothetical protein TNCV_1611111 [Trichonephila clavipes]
MSLRFVQNKFELPPALPAHVRREERNPLSSSAHLRHSADQLICHFPLPPAAEEREKPLSLLYEGILETGGVMGQYVQMWTRNYGALDQTARVCFGVLCATRKKEEVKRDFGPANKKERGACCEHTPGV